MQRPERTTERQRRIGRGGGGGQTPYKTILNPVTAGTPGAFTTANPGLLPADMIDS